MPEIALIDKGNLNNVLIFQDSKEDKKINKPSNVKKLQKPIHVAKYMYKKHKKVNMFPKQISGTSPKPFTKESILLDIRRRTSGYSSCCAASFVNGKLLLSCKAVR